MNHERTETGRGLKEGRESDIGEDGGGESGSTRKGTSVSERRVTRSHGEETPGLTLADFGATVWANERCQTEFLAINPFDARIRTLGRSACGKRRIGAVRCVYWTLFDVRRAEFKGQGLYLLNCLHYAIPFTYSIRHR